VTYLDQYHGRNKRNAYLIDGKEMLLFGAKPACSLDPREYPRVYRSFKQTYDMLLVKIIDEKSNLTGNWGSNVPV